MHCVETILLFVVKEQVINYNINFLFFCGVFFNNCTFNKGVKFPFAQGASDPRPGADISYSDPFVLSSYQRVLRSLYFLFQNWLDMKVG